MLDGMTRSVAERITNHCFLLCVLLSQAEAAGKQSNESLCNDNGVDVVTQRIGQHAGSDHRHHPKRSRMFAQMYTHRCMPTEHAQ